MRSSRSRATFLLNVPRKFLMVFFTGLDKADTRGGKTSIQHLADFGAPYAMLLYERFLGRSFAAHRDSVSELVGDVLETAIERALHDKGCQLPQNRQGPSIYRTSIKLPIL